MRPSARLPSPELATRRKCLVYSSRKLGLVGNFHVFDAAMGNLTRQELGLGRLDRPPGGTEMTTPSSPIDYKCLVYYSLFAGGRVSVSGDGPQTPTIARFGPSRSPSRPRTDTSSTNAWCILRVSWEVGCLLAGWAGHAPADAYESAVWAVSTAQSSLS